MSLKNSTRGLSSKLPIGIGTKIQQQRYHVWIVPIESMEEWVAEEIVVYFERNGIDSRAPRNQKFYYVESAFVNCRDERRLGEAELRMVLIVIFSVDVYPSVQQRLDTVEMASFNCRSQQMTAFCKKIWFKKINDKI
jgi:hypothetical protein